MDDYYFENPFFAHTEDERKLRKYLINANMKINNLMMNYGVLRYLKEDYETMFLFGWYEDYENYPLTYEEFKQGY